MARPPRVVGLIVCRRLDVNPTVGELSVVGVVHTLRVPSWTEPAPPFTVYTLLHGGRGEGAMQLAISRLDTETTIHRWTHWYVVPDPSLVVHREIPIRQCRFPGPGRYGLSFRFDGKELAWRFLEVRALEEAS
jgi:hypothetical protein